MSADVETHASPARSDAGENLRRLLTRPAFDEAGIWIRPEGRQLMICRGVKAEPDADAEADAEAGAEAGAEADAPAKRGRITGFSAGSRRRLRRTVHAVERGADCLFITLTWHETEPTPEEAHRALDRFWKRLTRRMPGLSAVWKMEPQKRGVPHFHLIVYGTRWINARWLSEMWHDVTGETSDAHRKSGVDTEWIRGGHDGKLMAYLSKYMDKELDSWPDAGGDAWKHPGRFWGVLNREALPVAAWSTWFVPLHGHEAASLIMDLLETWDVDLPEGVVPPSLTVNTRGDPEALLDALT